MPGDEFEHVYAVQVRDTGFGFDQFGMEKETAILAVAIVRYLHKYWFRVQSEGIENVPLTGRCIVVPNHSGVIPIDAVMLGVDIAVKMKKARIMRAMVDNFVGFMPYLNVFFTRVGQVVGARRNFSDLLNNDELMAVFPEGTKGVGKPFSQRYQLQRFNVGFIELSLNYKAPLVPVAIIGAEEQAPLLANLKPLARLIGLPYFPVTPFFPLLGPLGMIPLPVQYHIYYGKPLHYYGKYPPETANDPETIRMLADRVQMIVQDMVIQGLDKRKAIFGLGEN